MDLSTMKKPALIDEALTRGVIRTKTEGKNLTIDALRGLLSLQETPAQVWREAPPRGEEAVETTRTVVDGVVVEAPVGYVQCTTLAPEEMTLAERIRWGAPTIPSVLDPDAPEAVRAALEEQIARLDHHIKHAVGIPGRKRRVAQWEHALQQKLSKLKALAA